MRDRTPVQSVAALVGVVFVLVGVIGFIPGITTQYHDLSFAGHDSGAKLLGIFQVSILHNLVHLLFGLAGIALAKTAAGARSFLTGGGARLSGALGARRRRWRRLDSREHRRQLAALRARDRDDRPRLRHESLGGASPFLCALSISARISRAISAGVSPPRSRPTGPWMRSASAPSFSRRFSCVRREPSAPT
jgi:hypothetical protein